AEHRLTDVRTRLFTDGSHDVPHRSGIPAAMCGSPAEEGRLHVRARVDAAALQEWAIEVADLDGGLPLVGQWDVATERQGERQVVERVLGRRIDQQGLAVCVQGK